MTRQPCICSRLNFLLVITFGLLGKLQDCRVSDHISRWVRRVLTMPSADAYKLVVAGRVPCKHPETARQKKTPSHSTGRFWLTSLTMTYFHTGIRTIIGAEAFHFPVRDGKEWYHLAMVVRHNFLSS